MSIKMRESLLSNCERNFLNRSIDEDTRLDGRSVTEARPVHIYFGSDWGCSIVSLGRTKVIARITSEIQQPKSSRPNEGMIYINAEINPLAAQHFDSGKQTEATVLINRQLKKCFEDSRCVDLESLCIITDKKVWNLRIDINVINHDGNLIDCASIAALAALLHFHRPDVTSDGENVIIHPASEKDPLPLTLSHHPVCVSFVTFENGTTVIDPTYIEEKVGVAQLTLGLNSYQELCSLHFDYLMKTATIEDVISTVSSYAANYANKLVAQIKATVANDVSAKYNKHENNVCRFRDCIESKKITTMINECINIKLPKWSTLEKEESDNTDVCMTEDNDEDTKIINSGAGSAELIIQNTSVGEGGPNTWYIPENSSEDESSKTDVKIIQQRKKPAKRVIAEIEISEDSEEETTEVISKKDIMQ